MHHSLSKLSLAAFGATAFCGSPAVAQVTTRISVDTYGLQANGYNRLPSSRATSADGRYVVFESDATNLVPGDTNGQWDVFVHDVQSGVTTRASMDSNGVQGDSSSHDASISADGRYVAFDSPSDNLVSGDTNGTGDCFVHDRQTGTTERVSVAAGGAEGNGDSGAASISADGRFVAFISNSTNLVLGDTNGWTDVFLRDRQTGTTELVSIDSIGAQANSSSYTPSITVDGRFVAFASSASNLVLGDTNGAIDVFVRDRQNGTTERVSVASGGAQASGNSGRFGLCISADGRYVAFESDATDLVPGDTNGFIDVFVHDRQSGTTQRVNVATSGAQTNLDSYLGSISSDGRFVAFSSAATNLVAGDTNATDDIFVHDRLADTTERVSVATGGAQGDSGSYEASLSADGSYVAFSSGATNLVAGDTNGFWDIFVRDLTCIGSIFTYCTPKTNSLGCVPAIGAQGLPSQNGPDDFFVTASNVRNNKLGMMLWSLAPDNHPFFGGTLCLHSPIKRTPGQNSGGSATGNDCTGSYSYHFTQVYMLQQLLGADTTVYAQFWSRDPGFAPPNNIGLTNGLQFTICP